MKTVTKPYDAADYLADPAMIKAYLDEALASGNAGEVAVCLGNISRARGMGAVAVAAQVSRPSLYRALSDGGNPSLSTLMGVVEALGFKLTVEPATETEAAA